MPAVPHRLTGRVVLALALLGMLACGPADNVSAGGAGDNVSAGGAAVGFGERLKAPDGATVLEALMQPHKALRGRLGPHRLETTATFELSPAAPPADAPAEGAAVVLGDAVRDTLSLTWAGEDATGPAFELRQANDKERGRNIVVTGGQLYAQLAHRPYTAQALETEIFELWLDDAQTSVGDVVAFVGPGASMEVARAAGGGLAGADTVTMTFALGDGLGATAAADPRSKWRENASFTRVAGSVVLDAATGAWLNADLAATYTVADVQGRLATGTVHLTGQVTPLEAAPPIQAPVDAVVLPTRERYDLERQRILDGLAAP